MREDVGLDNSLTRSRPLDSFFFFFLLKEKPWTEPGPIMFQSFYGIFIQP